MKLKLAAVALLASTAIASAADLPARTYTKAPITPVAQVYNWTGFYLGAFGGYGFGGKLKGDNTDFDNDGIDDVTSISGVKGGFGGGTIGYNWQAPGSRIVWGFEVDAAGASLKQNFADVDSTFSYKVNAFGTVTGRVGFAVDNMLIYAKGGYAWASTKFSASDGPESFTSSKTHSGYAVGAGLEYAFLPSWSAKAEYLYADYGKATYGPSPDGDTGRVGLTNHTVKVGINYHFNSPVVARY